jgi:hypothetical protein
VSDEGTTDAILLAEPQRHTATGTAIAYGVEITPAFDNGMNKPSPVAVLQYLLGFFSGYFVGIMWHSLQQDVSGGPEQYLDIYRMITVVKYLPAGAGTDGQAFGDIHQVPRFRRGKQIGAVHVAAVGVGYPPDQPPEHGYSGPPAEEYIELEEPPASFVVEL